MIGKLLSTIVFASIIFAGCGENKDNPPKVVLGQDPCDNCFMIINEKKFAASIWLSNGEGKRFDDIGCMIDYINKNKITPKAYWVYDFKTSEPLKSENAFYINSDSLVTPMGFGIAAFKSKNDASASAEEYKTEIISFNELINKYHKLKTE